jgi:hypothetical protein
MIVFAKRRDATCVDYHNCKAINGLSGVVATHSDRQFEHYMQGRGYTVVWVADLDATWERQQCRRKSSVIRSGDAR